MIKCKGFTLLELMASTTILAILTAIVVPNFSIFIIKMRVDNEIFQLHRLLMITRNSAINMNQNVTLCPLDQSLKCSDQWQNKLSVFIDNNNNSQLDIINNEKIIRVKPAIKVGEKLQYGLLRKRIVFAPTGRTTGWGSNGTLKYCPNNHPSFSRSITIATSGRFYLSSDFNHDGKNRNRRGIQVNCRN
jgi:type IV fimbrial biogenesis protein FimT